MLFGEAGAHGRAMYQAGPAEMVGVSWLLPDPLTEYVQYPVSAKATDSSALLPAGWWHWVFLPTEVAEHGAVLVGCRGLSSQRKLCSLATEQQNMRDMTEGGLDCPKAHLLLQTYQLV